MISTGTESAPRPPARSRWLPALALITVTAFLLRLVPVLTGGGLYGRGNYDDGVYYAAASGFVHGLLPYRDFLLLHPPGIVLALAPFAALADMVGDPTALAVSRVAFMIIGTVNAVLVATALRRLGLTAALIGGMVYAVALPAVYVEHTTLLEPLATTCLVAAIGLTLSAQRGTSRTGPALVAAGALLGVSSSIKIWGVVPAAAVLIWVLIMLGWRRALLVAGAVMAGAVAVCGPFFAAAPGQMWQLVVVSQLGRPPTGAGWLGRAWMITGLNAFQKTPIWWALLLALVVVVCAAVGAWQSPVGRLAVAVLTATLTVLFVIPSWFLHYAALSVAPLALVVGAAAGWFSSRVHRPVTSLVAVATSAVLLGGYAATVVQLPFGQPFPTAALATAVASSKTCVTTDNPISLIELDVLRQNRDRGCPLVVDLGGYSYYMQPIALSSSRVAPTQRGSRWLSTTSAAGTSPSASVSTPPTGTAGPRSAPSGPGRSWPARRGSSSGGPLPPRRGQ